LVGRTSKPLFPVATTNRDTNSGHIHLTLVCYNTITQIFRNLIVIFHSSTCTVQKWGFVIFDLLKKWFSAFWRTFSFFWPWMQSDVSGSSTMVFQRTEKGVGKLWKKREHNSYQLLVAEKSDKKNHVLQKYF
jgi:hypothetical protein